MWPWWYVVMCYMDFVLHGDILASTWCCCSRSNLGAWNMVMLWWKVMLWYLVPGKVALTVSAWCDALHGDVLVNGTAIRLANNVAWWWLISSITNTMYQHYHVSVRAQHYRSRYLSLTHCNSSISTSCWTIAPRTPFSIQEHNPLLCKLYLLELSLIHQSCDSPLLRRFQLLEPR